MKKALVMMVLGMLVSVAGWGQGTFVRFYDDGYFWDVAQLNNGNYVCVGNSQLNSRSYLVVTYDIYGQKINVWEDTMIIALLYKVIPTTDNGFITTGLLEYPDSTEFYTVARFDSSSNLLWKRQYNLGQWPPVQKYATPIIQTLDGGFLFGGNKFVTPASISIATVIKIDGNGDTMWSYNWGTANYNDVRSIVATSDGGYLLAGSADTSHLFVVKLNGSGIQEWDKIFNFQIGYDSYVNVLEKPSSDFVISFSQMDTGVEFAKILTINNVGDVLSSIRYNNYDEFHDLVAAGDGGYVASGISNSAGIPNMLLLKLDSSINQVWRHVYPLSAGWVDWGYGMSKTRDGGYAVAGQNNGGILIKTNAFGEVPHSWIKGKVIGESNVNCTTDSGEPGLRNKILQVDIDSTLYYGISDLDGDYSIQVYDTGQATVNWVNPQGYWDPSVCQGTGFMITLPYNDTLEVDLYAEPVINCPDLTVTARTTMPALRRCFPNTYVINYCNDGTAATNAYIEVEMDPYLIVDSASIPWATPQSGNIYRFNLGQVGIGQCGSFYIYTTLSCIGTEIFQSHCVTAHIYPDSICLPPDPLWDGSSLKLTGKCTTGDTVEFTIENVGTGDMTAPSFFLIAEDNVMYKQGQFELNVGQSLVERIPGNGSTFMMTVDQVIGHPGYSFPMVAIEGCGRNNQGTYSKRFVEQYPQDDLNGFIDIVCTLGYSSYDPNDKRPEPLGIAAQGFINATQPLDYTIRFQNTGNDTAFIVVIRDTLSPYLDITTLYLTGASHPYTFQIIGSNVLEWTFANILLPDSNVNEPLSHGFVGFHIQQADNNAVGTEITNRAGIYFDFNAVVLTNTTLNTVTEDYKTLFTFIQSPDGKVQLGIYPNPNNGTFSLDFAAKTSAAYEFAIYDLAGAKQFGQVLEGQSPFVLRPELSSGMYIYQLLEDGQPVGTGKVVVNR